jgi:hypothetical protein
MPFSPSSSLFQKNNARNINYMAVLIFLKYLDLRKNVYSRATSCNDYFKRSASSSFVSIDLGVGLRLSATTLRSMYFRRSTPNLALTRERSQP